MCESWEDQVDDSIRRLDERQSACAESVSKGAVETLTIQEELSQVRHLLMRVTAVLLDPTTDLTAVAQSFVNLGSARTATTPGASALEIWRKHRG